jgi:plasmid maintenance system antidote protein VapI
MSSNSPTIPTEFVAESFETEVSENETGRLLEVINSAVSNLRTQIEDETVENLLRAGIGSYELSSSMAVGQKCSHSVIVGLATSFPRW